MKLQDRDKIFLMLLFGIGGCILAIIYLIVPQFETKKRLDTEITQLNVRLNELNQKAAKREEFENGIVEFTDKYTAVLNCFPADLNQEVTLMFLDGIKETNEFTIETLDLGEKSPFYALMSNTKNSVPATSATTTSTSGTTTEAGTTESTTTETTTLVESDKSENDDVLTCYKAEFPIAYKGSYASLKDVVNYIENYSDRMAVESMDISYSDENEYTGKLELICYSVEGASRPERSLELNDVEIGVDNIFVGGSGTVSSGVSLNKYDDMDGAAIESSYDFYTMLNAATSDVSAKIIGQNGTGKEATVISDSENTVSTVSYDFYEVDGKVYCKYTLDNDKSYEAEVTSAEDVKVVIQSSERKNDADKVGVKITVRNSTSMPVYVKVSGDDSVSPRVSITKTGLVKIYQ